MKIQLVKFIGVIFLGLILNEDTLSQCASTPASTTDLIALPTTSNAAEPACPLASYITTTSNTGTDIYFDGNNNCQVMVWDGTLASLSWQYGSAKGSVPFTSLPAGGILLDPDVVVHKMPGGAVYALLVAEVSTGAQANRIFWASFKWSGSAFVLFSSGFLADLTNGPARNPNVDVNSCGRIAVVWHQRITFPVTLTSQTTTIGLTFPATTITMSRGDIFLAEGSIDGAGCSGSVIAGVVPNGDRISVPGSFGISHLFEVNINPDVSFAEPQVLNDCGSSRVVSVTYINQWFDPAVFAIKTQLIFQQLKGNPCIPGASGTYRTEVLNCGNHAGRPRIASRPISGTYFDDAQIVMADPSASCNISGPPCNPWNTKIYTWGRFNGVGPSATPSILTTAPVNGCNLTTFYNNEAVIAYRNPSYANQGDFVVAWTNAGGVTGVVGNDIVARTYNQGNANLLAVGVSRLSIVNRGCSTQLGNQYLPSIAGRFSKPVAYAHFDQGVPARAYIAYKTSDKQPGSTAALRPDNLFDREILTASETFSVRPNPFTDKVIFEIGSESKATLAKIEISDQHGRIVKILAVPEKTTSLTWQVESSLPAGVYYAKLISASGVQTTTITRMK